MYSDFNLLPLRPPRPPFKTQSQQRKLLCSSSVRTLIIASWYFLFLPDRPSFSSLSFFFFFLFLGICSNLRSTCFEITQKLWFCLSDLSQRLFAGQGLCGTSSVSTAVLGWLVCLSQGLSCDREICHLLYYLACHLSRFVKCQTC